MDSVGVFLEKEIDGKPFYIFTLSSPSSSSSGEAAIDLCDDNELSPQEPLFICPTLRREAEMPKRSIEEGDAYPFTISPHLIESNNQIITITHEDISEHTLLPLFWCNNKKYNDRYCFACLEITIGTTYYMCVRCDMIFHKECVESPLSIKHPSYPFFPFQLYDTQYTKLSKCIICDTWPYRMTYYCSTLKIAMHTLCAVKPIPIVINHLKRHHHPLAFFPRQASLVCNVCGIIKEWIPTYVCARCDFVAHQDCIYFPYVIRISRHQHRISFTYSLPSGNWSCGVCRTKIDNSYYGAYSCHTCDGGYFVHTRCALRSDLWDGKELEGVAEEPEIIVPPFQTMGDGIILHFSHSHHNLQLLKMSKVYDENKYCQACVLPIYEGTYYSCMSHCDYILHETCANAPLKKHNPLHAHSLTLKVVTSEYTCRSLFETKKGHFDCHACRRISCGFVYETTSKDTYFTEDKGFRLDLRCTSISEPFEYQGHQHPLYLALSPTEELTVKCQICQDYREYHIRGFTRKLNCIECNDYVICFKCATLPFKARYKHDKHFLTFKKEVVDGSDWCEACEKEIVYSEKGGYYACDEYCCTALHADCLLGKDPYMKPGKTIKSYDDIEFAATIHRNNTLTRPLCSHCKERCQHKVVFKYKGKTFCSLYHALIR